jgi:anaerobic selenocysteine-containing dehydrogenase
LIVVVPAGQTAELADPGSSFVRERMSSLMAMINVIIEKGLYDKQFVEKWCHGFDKLMERARHFLRKNGRGNLGAC